MIVLALGPLGFRYPIAEAHATSRILVVPFKTSVDDVAAPAAPAEATASRERLVRFAWPTHGTITQGFFDYHPGIDIANDVGPPEVAADAGQVVAQGQRIGLMGATVRASGPHLHFEIRYQGIPQNPIDLLS